MTMSIASGPELPRETLWRAIKAYWQNVPLYNEAGNYAYWIIVPTVGDDFVFLMSAWFAPNMTITAHQNLVEPLLNLWSEMGVVTTPSWQEFDSYLPAWRAMTDAEIVGTTNSKIASRLIPLSNLEDPVRFHATAEALQDLLAHGVVLVGYSLSGSAEPSLDNAVNPAWRENALYIIQAVTWPKEMTWSEVSDFSLQFTNEWLKPLRDVSPVAGSYHSEGDIIEPDFQQSFYGSKTYDRLYKFKKQVDPTGVLYAHNGVGSEDWFISDQLPGLPTQNGRLCRVV